MVSMRGAPPPPSKSKPNTGSLLEIPARLEQRRLAREAGSSQSDSSSTRSLPRSSFSTPSLIRTGTSSSEYSTSVLSRVTSPDDVIVSLPDDDRPFSNPYSWVKKPDMDEIVPQPESFNFEFVSTSGRPSSISDTSSNRGTINESYDGRSVSESGGYTTVRTTKTTVRKSKYNTGNVSSRSAALTKDPPHDSALGGEVYEEEFVTPSAATKGFLRKVLGRKPSAMDMGAEKAKIKEVKDRPRRGGYVPKDKD